MSPEAQLKKLEEAAPVIIWRGSAGQGHPTHPSDTRLVEIYEANLDGTGILDEEAPALGKGTSLAEAIEAMR